MRQLAFVIASLIIYIALSITIFAQNQERTIKLVKWRNEPLEIKKLEVSGNEVGFNQPFNAEGNDWFRGLTVTVKNVSNQTIYSIDIGLLFYSTEAGSIPSRDHLIYGCEPPLTTSAEVNALKCDEPPLKPNETATFTLQNYESTRKFLDDTRKPAIINEFELTIGEVMFADRRRWIGGEIMKPDPNNPRRWIPEKKEPENHK